MKSIGLDIHSANFTFSVLSEKGKIIQCLSRETSKKNLIESISSISGEKQLTVEECHMAQWVKNVLEPYVDKLVVCDPTQNKWIANAEFNDDKISAVKLARLLQGGYIKEIHHPDEEAAEFRSLFLHYYDLDHQLTRFKNKLKSTYRQMAISTNVKDFYTVSVQEELREHLKDVPYLEHEAFQLFIVADTLDHLKEKTTAKMVKRAKQDRCFVILDGIPGAGSIITTGYLALLETPHRFSCRNKLWSYAGYGNKLHKSDGVVYSHHASKSGNRVLKWLVTQHFHGAVHISKKSNRFKRKYNELLAKGLDATGSRRQVCRSILSTVLAMWKKEEPYRDDF